MNDASQISDFVQLDPDAYGNKAINDDDHAAEHIPHMISLDSTEPLSPSVQTPPVDESNQQIVPPPIYKATSSFGPTNNQLVFPFIRTLILILLTVL